MRFPFTKQTDSMMCGIACLVSVCRYYGTKYSPGFIDKFCSHTEAGVSLLSLSKAAEAIGFDTMCVSLPHDKLTECQLPIILHWNQNHYVVLYRIDRKKDRFYICDPGKGRFKLPTDEFLRYWSGDRGKGIALLLEPGADFGKVKEDSDIDRTSLKIIFDYIKGYRKYLIQISLGLLLGCLLQLALPFLTQSIVDVGIKNSDISFIWLILLGELLIVAGRTVTDFIRRWLLLHISMRINVSMVSDFFIKLLKLPMSFFEAKLIGDLMQRVGDHRRVQAFLTNQILGSVFSFFSLIVFGIVLFIYSKVIFLIFIAGSVFYALWVLRFLMQRKVLDYESFEQESINQSKTYQFLTAMQEIKLQGCKKRRRWDWEDTQADLFAVQMKSLKLQQTQEAGSIFINEVKNILITVFSATAVIEGDITFGAMMAIQYIVGQLSSPIEQLMIFVYSFQDMKLSLERINEIHNGTDEETGRNNITGYGSQKSIVLRDVCFKYEAESPKYTLKNVSIDIPAGKVTAIVGASGCGKTTLIKLMLGYYNLMSGSIEVAETNLQDYNPDWWRRQCGVVMQDGFIFSESIARNIAVDDNPIDWDRLHNAARIACIYDHIQQLPLGYDTKIGQEGAGLSQGQKQRILIARAVYKDPDFIFLDEATNALDARNERMIVDNLSRFYQGKTVIVVAHRLSTVRNADQIIVLDNGMVAEHGTHDDLIALKGAYYNLIKNQLELGN